MDTTKATSVLQLALYPLAAFDGFARKGVPDKPDIEIAGTEVGERSKLQAARVVCNVASCELSIVELTDGRVALLWPAHGELHASLDALRSLCFVAMRGGNNEVSSPLNHHEYTRLEFACE